MSAAAVPLPIREAATVMLLRDASGGPEVFMVRRTLGAAFGPGFYVFPGGRLDDADGAADVAGLCDGLSDAGASVQLGVAAGGLAYWVAAIRECFEEAGALLAHTADGEPVDFSDPVVEERFTAHRHAVHRGERSMAQVCAAEGLRLSAGDLAYLFHWITPPGDTRRFSTRFLVARAPAGQEPLHDDSETIASCWLTPAAALGHYRRGEWELMPPTVGALEFLAAHERVDAALAGTRALRPATPGLPRLRYGDMGRVWEVYPDDPEYGSTSALFEP